METKIICPFCEEILRSGSSCYWHLRREHDVDHDEAFEQTGALLEENNRFESWKDRMRRKYPDGDVSTWINLPE